MPDHLAVLLGAVLTFAVVRRYVAVMIRDSRQRHPPHMGDRPASTPSEPAEAVLVAWTDLDDLQYQRCVDRR